MLRRLRVFLVLLFAALGSTAPIAPGARAQDAPAQLSTSQEAAAVRKVRRAIARNRLTRLRPACLLFQAYRNDEGNTAVDVRELHDKKCGGDPAVAPRLFTIEIDRKTGRMQTDAGSLTGDYRKLR